MTDAGPHVFRNLESSAGRESFDAIVLAAVAAYAGLAAPSASQARDFGRLVAPLFGRIGEETRRSVAASLATAPCLPREVLELLIAEPLEVSAPFLLSTTLLTPDDHAALDSRREAATRRKRRSKGEGAAKSSPTPRREALAPAAAPFDLSPSPEPAEPKADVAAPRLSSSRQTELLSGGLTAGAGPNLDAEETRQRLRQLVLLGQPAKRKPADLLSLAIAGQAEAFFLTLATRLFLDREQVKRIERDPTGMDLAVALKAADVATADALTMLMMLKPALGTDVAAFEAMERSYAGLSTDECAARFKRGVVAHERVYEESAGAPSRAPSRPSFGRRNAAAREALRRKTTN